MLLLPIFYVRTHFVQKAGRVKSNPVREESPQIMYIIMYCIIKYRKKSWKMTVHTSNAHLEH